MKLAVKRLFSIILTIALLAGLIPADVFAASEPISLTENEIPAVMADSGAFYLASSSAKLPENIEGPYYFKVKRGGDNLPAASVAFEILDISTRYGEDYTLESTEFFGPKVENADVPSLMEQFASGDYEESMVDENGNDLSLTDEEAEELHEEAEKEIQTAVGAAMEQYIKDEAAEDGIDLDKLAEYEESAAASVSMNSVEETEEAEEQEEAVNPEEAEKQEEKTEEPEEEEPETVLAEAMDPEAVESARKLAESEENENQSELSRAFEEDTGLMDDRTPIKSASETGGLTDILYAGYGLNAMNDIASLIDVPLLTLNFEEGESEKCIELKIKDNNIGEGDKFMMGKLVSLTEDILVAEEFSGFTMTIEDDEEWVNPSVTFADPAYILEGGYAEVTVKREGLATMVSTVHMTSSNGSAISGRDYSEVDTDVVFPYGVTERLVKIPVRSEYLDSDADFVLTLSNPVSAELGSCSQTSVVISKDAESYVPEGGGNNVVSDAEEELIDASEAEKVGISYKLFLTETADPLDLSKTNQADAGGAGYSRMEDDAYVIKASSKVYDEVSSCASWYYGRHYGYSGLQIDWQKSAGKPAYTDNEVKMNERDPETGDYSYKTKLDDSDERWDRKTTNFYSDTPISTVGLIRTYRQGAFWGCDVTIKVYSIKPILRPFEITLVEPETSALKFIDKDGKYVPYTQIGNLEYISETNLMGGNIKYTKSGSDEITVSLKNASYSWIKKLQVVQYDNNGNVTGYIDATGDLPQGTSTASITLNDSSLNKFTNANAVKYVDNKVLGYSKGLKGQISVRAVLEPYDVDATIDSSDERSTITPVKPSESTPYHKGDYFIATVNVNDAYKNKYNASGVESNYQTTSNDSVVTRHWDCESGTNRVIEQLNYSKVSISPWLSEKDNRLIVKVPEDAADLYDHSKGFFTTAEEIPSEEEGYLFYCIANKNELKTNYYYELTAEPKAGGCVAKWSPDFSNLSYCENTYYFKTSVQTENNVITLNKPETTDTRLSLTGTVFYSGATLDNRVEGEAWLPAPGALVISDDYHFASSDADGNFVVEPDHEGNLPLYCVKGTGITYKVVSGGSVQYSSALVEGNSNSNNVITLNRGSHKVPVVDKSKPYVAAVVPYDINGAATNSIPITADGITTITVTVNNCGADLGNGEKENTVKLELLSYRPGVAEPVTLEVLSKDDESNPYQPFISDNTEIWTFRTSFGDSTDVVSGDKLYVRLTTDYKAATVYDENNKPIENNVFNATTYPPVDTGSVFYQPDSDLPETYDMNFMDGEFMKEYFKLPILGSMKALFRISGFHLSMMALPNGGQRIYVGYMPKALSDHTQGLQNSDTGEKYGTFDFSKAWNDIFEMGEAARCMNQRINILKGGGVNLVFGVYIDYGMFYDDGDAKFEFMGGGAYAGVVAKYKVIVYFAIGGFPFYAGGDTKLQVMLSGGFHAAEQEVTLPFIVKDKEYDLDWSVNGSLTVNVYFGAGICGIIGARGGAYISGNFLYWPQVAKWFSAEDQALKNAGYEDGLRNAGLKLSAAFRVWFDVVFATLYYDIWEFLNKPMGYYEDIATLSKIRDSMPAGLVGSGSDTSSDGYTLTYKEAGEESVWVGPSGRPMLRSTFSQTGDIEIKTGGYDHADPQLLELGDNKYLLVYVDEDSSISGDDRTVLRYQIYDSTTGRWLAVPGEIRAIEEGTVVNGALEPDLTDAGGNVLITWTALTLPDADHSDSEYAEKYFRERNVYAAVISKDTLKSASSSEPASIDGTLVSGNDTYYDSNPKGMYYNLDGKDHYKITYLTSEASVSDDSLDAAEQLLAIASPAMNNSYVRQAEFTSESDTWDNSFNVMRLNSSYDGASGTWSALGADDTVVNNPTTIDLDTAVWKDWAIYSFIVDMDNDLSTDEDRQVFVKIENLESGNASVTQVTHDVKYTDSEGVEHIGLAKARPQLIESGGIVYLFWQQGKEDVAWTDFSTLIESEQFDQTTAIVNNPENITIGIVFYPTVGVDIDPSFTNFRPFVDELDNLYIVWTQSILEDGVTRQELYASSLKNNDLGLDRTWSDPVRLTESDAGDYSMVINDEPAMVSLGNEELLVVCNRFLTPSNPDESAVQNLTMRGIRFETVASVIPAEITSTNKVPAPGEALDLQVIVKNDGLKNAQGFALMLLLVDKAKYEAAGGKEASYEDVVDAAVSMGVYGFEDTAIAPSETNIVTVNEDNYPVDCLRMPAELADTGYTVVGYAAEVKSGEHASSVFYPGMPFDAFDDVVEVTPEYDIVVETDTNRHENASLASKDFPFSAVITSTGNTGIRENDRLIVGPANLHNVNEYIDTTLFLDIPLSELEDVETEYGSGKSITTELKIDPSYFTYGFAELYAEVVDENYQPTGSLQTLKGFTISTEAPYYVGVTDSETDQLLGNEITLETGDDIAMVGSYEPANHFRGGNVVYSVQNSDIANVDENGNLTAISPGTTYLYASVDKYDAVRTYKVTVTGDPVYNVTLKPVDNGTAEVSVTSGTEGTEVTVTAKPDNGYEIDKITYTTEDGTTVDITDSKSFKLPASSVTVEVTYKKIAESENEKTESTESIADSKAESSSSGGKSTGGSSAGGNTSGGRSGSSTSKTSTTKTGDTSNPVLWLVLIFVSGCLLASLVLLKKKKKH